jgi:hypothetical protein
MGGKGLTRWNKMGSKHGFSELLQIPLMIPMQEFAINISATSRVCFKIPDLEAEDCDKNRWSCTSSPRSCAILKTVSEIANSFLVLIELHLYNSPKYQTMRSQKLTVTSNPERSLSTDDCHIKDWRTVFPVSNPVS